MRKTKLLLILLASLIISAQAQDNKIEFVEYDMDNGLHVILHQDNTTPIVTVSVLYHVGSKNEPAGRTGFAHFFEHLMFEGSPNIKRGEFFKIIQKAGGQLNANTSHDRTFYYETLPSHQLELGLYMESERMLHAKIDSTGIATQKEVVKEEKRLRIDNQPYMSFQEKMFAKAFHGTNYEWTPIGSFEDIDAATEQDFADFYATFYVPNNATLSIAGDINIKETKELVEKYFGEIKSGNKEIPRPDIKVPDLGSEVRDVVFDNIQLPAVIQAYRMPAQGTEDYYALDMLTTLLSGGQSSRFQKEIVDKQQLAAAVFAFPFALEDAGLFTTIGLANVGKTPEELEVEMDAQVDRVKNELIGDKEFQKLQNQLENNFVSRNSSVQGIAESLADYHVYYGDANLINSEIDRYRKVTKEDIQRVAKKYLTKDNRVVLYYLSKSAQQKPEDSELNKEGN
ncbi:pitrilysin family protein [Fulvivirgaceae bacterium BMA10]|uniref:Pitrilysin family protein n=1 Tax=Splendidivirga corallicola TaxID=3051826 RepID=A0ABT8KS44_9BACT|nr:pitrilysin family protein [Fulvivirgaceae bacterium BMA10]MDN5205718.1 pitrilysin family protein [Fulvivirgaceae bacterium BMA10]